MARSSTAEAHDAVLPGSAGSLHGSDPYLRLQAPPVRRADWLHTGGRHRLLGGAFDLLAFCLYLHVKNLSKPQDESTFVPLFLRPSTSRPCLRAPAQICH